MNRFVPARALLLTVVTAVSLTGCSGGDSGATPAAGPTRTSAPAADPTTPSATPTPTTAAQIADSVTEWYETGGETVMVSLISEAAKVQAGRKPSSVGTVHVDFGPLFDTIPTAEAYGDIADPAIRTAWSKAVVHLGSGAREVLASSPRPYAFPSAEQSEQAHRGWREFDRGIKGLKAAQARLDRTFGLKPPADPWKAKR
ncbi:hypothetical protein [Streptomyces sp. NPDC054887]